MSEIEVTGPYVGALMMSLGAVCLFIWGVLSGALSDANETAKRFYEREVRNDERAPKRSFEPPSR